MTDGGAATDSCPSPSRLPLTFLVRQAWLSLRTAIDETLSTQGLSVAQYATLLVLEQHPGLSIAELARMVVSTRQSANELLAGMAQDGLVERRPHPNDGRVQQNFLTTDGRARLEAARPAVHAREEQLEAGLSEADREAARAWLAHLTRTRAGG